MLSFLAVFCIITSTIIYYKSRNLKPEVKYLTSSWIKITENPPTDDYEEYLITDGEVVYHKYGLSYNKKGQIVFSYKSRIATHWLPFPQPPKEK